MIKREALINIYSLMKQNIKLCNANQVATATKIAKKTNFARAAHFFVHFVAVVLHENNVKLPETS